MSATTSNELWALSYDPFASDDSERKILGDNIVTARKSAKCHQCHEEIKPGQRIRSMRGVFEGEFMSFKWCQTCTELMAAGDSDALEDRFNKLVKPSLVGEV